MKPIVLFLTFNKDAQEAVNVYVSLFSTVFGTAKGESKIVKTTRYGEQELNALTQLPEVDKDIMPGPAGSVKHIRFLLNGQEFVALNGGGYFGKFHESMSLYVTCDTQQQIDRLWQTLSQGGEEQPCGWVKDKYGISWQIVPGIVMDIEEGDDHQKSQRANKALYGMKRIDIEKIRQA
ncbi:VOC family protein [Rhodocytophaga aerolata]|uniref:VOC family protein n=1 Tax=Rhodocytophaga aerolata TaxID=455078 RepID=A0ABT8RBB4_9BACT|nr:VOC family protein [Rhodocytophaga aerolata]MDO1449401.1 VOC family protein [Rhodocytophaga aerolata]